MTTDHQMATMYATQQEVIVALTEVDEVDLAGRLGRCMSARRSRTMATAGRSPADPPRAYGADDR
jgi:hypothetical protein